MAKLKLGVFASGSGTNLQAIIDACNKQGSNAQIAVVISNNSDSGALERARNNNIPCFHISGNQIPDIQKLGERFIEILTDNGVELVVLAGYMKLLPGNVIQNFPHKIINIHPALLPAFGGKGMYGKNVHAKVIAAGCKISGVTVHFVDEEFDRGPIIAQRTVEVKDDDSPEQLAARILPLEHSLYPEVIEVIAQGRVKVVDRKVFIL